MALSRVLVAAAQSLFVDPLNRRRKRQIDTAASSKDCLLYYIALGTGKALGTGNASHHHGVKLEPRGKNRIFST